MSKPNSSTSGGLKTTKLSLEILELVKEMDGAGVTRLANSLDLPPSTVHGHLTTLLQKEYLRKEDDIYCLGPKLLQLGHHVQNSNREYQIASNYAEQLYERTELRTTFVVEQNGRGVYFYSESGDHANWSHESVGNRLHLHYSAVGKAILSELPDERIDEILDRWGMPKRTSNTITDRDELFDEIETVRSQGYAINDGEMIQDLFAIGVPAVGPDGYPVGAFAVSVPSSAVDESRKKELIQTVTEIVDQYELELRLGEEPK